MPRTHDKEQEHEEGNPHEAECEKATTAVGLSEKDMKQLYATLHKMKIYQSRHRRNRSLKFRFL